MVLGLEGGEGKRKKQFCKNRVYVQATPELPAPIRDRLEDKIYRETLRKER